MKSILVGLGTMILGFILVGTIAMSISNGSEDATGLVTILSILYLSGVVAASTVAIIKKIEEPKGFENK